MKYTRIPETTFQELQLNAGVILSSFNPAAPESGTELVKALLGATSGGVNFAATPSFSDFGEAIDNAPVNVKELKRLDSWKVVMSGTFVTVNAALVKLLIGAADIDASDISKIVPRNDLTDADFKDIWWVGDYSDKNGDANGGFIAIHMMNTLSTGGFQLQSGNREKGQFPFEYTAHYSTEKQDTVPFEVYVRAGADETEVATTGEEV